MRAGRPRIPLMTGVRNRIDTMLLKDAPIELVDEYRAERLLAVLYARRFHLVPAN